jgi:hypothetical protein
LLTRPPGKQIEQGPKKGSGDIEDLQRMVKKLSNEITDMKRSAGDGNQGQRPYKPFFKINPPFKSIEPPLSNLNIDLGSYHLTLFVPITKKNILKETAHNGCMLLAQDWLRCQVSRTRIENTLARSQE